MTSIDYATRERILVMDDESCIRDTTKNLLLQIGYDADTAANGRAALRLYLGAKVDNRPYRFVILDLTVPGGPGALETLKELRRVDPEVRAIITSGFTYHPAMLNPRDFGFCGKLAKPYDISGLKLAFGLSGTEVGGPRGQIAPP
jgi:DNA-binding NtrC family response regulator